MSRIFYVHWNKDEALDVVRDLRGAGFSVGYHWSNEKPARIVSPLDVFVISLARLPSHGRAVAEWTREKKDMRDQPLVFLDGEEEKRARAREQFPRAIFCTRSQLIPMLSGLTST